MEKNMEFLSAELKKRGFSNAQIRSKVCAAVIDIMAETNGEFIDLKRAFDEVEELKLQSERIRKRISELRSEEDGLIDSCYVVSKRYQAEKEVVKHDVEKMFKERVEYIDQFFECLKTADTPEGRDSLRAAQMFVNSVNVDTKYDNTAFIVGLSAILSRGEVAPLKELKKINPLIPEVEIDSNGRVVLKNKSTRNYYKR